MPFFIYCKRNAPEHYDPRRDCVVPQDKNFRAIDALGRRVTRLTEAICFATREDAEEFIEKHQFDKMSDVQVEIRKRS